MKNTIIHVGFHKTGSTFLQEYFRQHPDIYFSRKTFETCWSDGNMDRAVYESDFKERTYVLSDMRLTIHGGGYDPVGLKRTGTYDIKKQQLYVAQELGKQFPDARILIVVRDFGRLVYSSYSQYLLNGGILSFSKFVSKQQEILPEMFDYDYVYSTYSEIFKPENVLVMPYEGLRENPAGFLADVEQALGLEHFEMDLHTVNESLPDQLKPFLLFSNKLVYGMVRPFPRRTRQKLFKRYVRFLFSLKEGFFSKFSHRKAKAREDEAFVRMVQAQKKKSEVIARQATVEPYRTFYI